MYLYIFVYICAAGTIMNEVVEKSKTYSLLCKEIVKNRQYQPITVYYTKKKHIIIIYIDYDEKSLIRIAHNNLS